MMRAMNALTIALLCGAMLAGGVFGNQCSDKLVQNFENNEGELSAKMTACLAEDAAEDCCAQVQELFAEDGALEDCLCDSDFFTMVLETIPSGGITADSMVDMWKSCGVPVVGTEACGSEEAEEPKVRAQLLLKKKILKKKLIAKKLVKKALLAKALLPKVAKVAPKPVAAAAPAVTPAVTPAAVPRAGKKAPKVVAASPPKKAPTVVTVAAPAKGAPAVPAPAPAVPAPAPVPAAVPVAPVPAAVPVQPKAPAQVKVTAPMHG